MEKLITSCKFSTDGGLFAIADGTNIVTVWDSCSSKQVCRITKSDWSTVKSLAWSHQKIQVGRKRKKRISSGIEKGSPYLAVGGNHGISLWDIKRDEELYATSTEGLVCVVGVSWGTDDVLFFCDGSPNVTQWNTIENTMEQWKCDKRCVCCICANSDGDLLVTGGRTIKMWNIPDHSLIKKFSGHVSNILDVTFLTPSLISTVADNDRTVCIWDTESDDSTTLVCESSVHMVTSSLHRDEVKVAAVCIEGLHTFSITSSIAKHTEPVSHTGTVKIKSKSNSQLLPILSAVMNTSSDIQLAHTSHIKPSFETIPFKQDNPQMCLERVVPKGLLLPDEDKPSRTPPTVKKQSVPVMGTGVPMVQWGRVNKELKEGALEDVPMSERLKALNITSKKEDQQKKVFPTADSLSVLVVQSVHSGDKTMLEDVLQASADERLVNATVRNLPVSAVVPFLKTLVDLLQTNPSRGPILSLWIKSILLIHTAYLLTVPHLLHSMSTLYQSMESRTATYTKLNRLRGKLDLLLAQCSGVTGSNGLSHQIQLLSKPLLSVTAGSDALVNDSDDEYDVGLFQSSEEENDVDEEDDNNESINSLSETEDMEDD